MASNAPLPSLCPVVAGSCAFSVSWISGVFRASWISSDVLSSVLPIPSALGSHRRSRVPGSFLVTELNEEMMLVTAWLLVDVPTITGASRSSSA